MPCGDYPSTCDCIQRSPLFCAPGLVKFVPAVEDGEEKEEKLVRRVARSMAIFVDFK